MPTVEPVSPALGARVTDVDLSQELTERQWEEIREAFHRHSVLVFPGQTLSIEDQKRFSRRFGDLLVHEHLLPMTVEGYPECMRLHNDADNPPGLNTWHTDNSGWPDPPLGTVLYAKTTPAIGGDTLFSNMYLAYEKLSPPMQEMLGRLTATHDAKKAFGEDYPELGEMLKKKSIEVDERFGGGKAVHHPIIRTHPETKRKALYISAPYVTSIDGLSAAEGRAILDFLYRHIETNEFVYRHRWQPGDLLIWDNRCLQHYAVADYHPHERLMYRMNILRGEEGRWTTS
ncbi:TauD/TfdA family dioxygenase [Actinomadura graeca]|uniref:TauD/TfdA family dioxygenase n=1 Tax=Actinomadura graeca TaxID=2750812 RepID=A0ABX8QTF1_9ACTN|nr:TauD/TfdA family dioxygenase [Actinomadura graeca]QXJ21234.1 TauD/TfdA family dioxygenase [Actinomadura graeca]